MTLAEGKGPGTDLAWFEACSFGHNPCKTGRKQKRGCGGEGHDYEWGGNPHGSTNLCYKTEKKTTN